MSRPAVRLIVGIPVRNEAHQITSCLEALEGQGVALDRVVLLLNNCTDGTAARVRAFQSRSSLLLDVRERTLAPHEANAGHARRVVMQICADQARDTDVLLTTDADGRVDRHWAAYNLAALADGVDVVCGRAEIDPGDAALIPASLHDDDAKECAYDRLLDEIHAWLDPDPADPMPRHTEASGASIAMTAGVYRACGGVPAVALGEDRALLEALRMIDARIRHAPEIRVTVSGRIVGRAVGGMADTIRRRLVGPDPLLDDRLEPAHDCVRRARLRGLLRQAGPAPGQAARAELAEEAGIDAALLAHILTSPGFGVRWSRIEVAGVNLRRRRVAASDLPREMAAAETILESLKSGVSPEGRDDILVFASAGPE